MATKRVTKVAAKVASMIAAKNRGTVGKLQTRSQTKANIASNVGSAMKKAVGAAVKGAAVGAAAGSVGSKLKNAVRTQSMKKKKSQIDPGMFKKRQRMNPASPAVSEAKSAMRRRLQKIDVPANMKRLYGLQRQFRKLKYGE